ncbi:1702_t:CDS:2, partial [Scutellospora calospora]
MTEVNNKSVINEAIVKDNISGAGTTNVHPFQELVKIVKPKIQQNIINAIANLDISQQHILCKARKKLIFNDTASESLSTSEFGSSSESSNDDEDFTVKV